MAIESSCCNKKQGEEISKHSAKARNAQHEESLSSENSSLTRFSCGVLQKTKNVVRSQSYWAAGDVCACVECGMACVQVRELFSQGVSSRKQWQMYLRLCPNEVVVKPIKHILSERSHYNSKLTIPRLEIQTQAKIDLRHRTNRTKMRVLGAKTGHARARTPAR